MAFPASIKIKDIEKTNPAYNADKVSDYDALYEGGDKFRDKIENFLTPRKSDKKNPEDYKLRAERAPYCNHAGGLIDWLTAAVFRDEPAFIVDEEAGENTREYWEGLNDDANGLGWNLSAVAREALRQVLLQGRSYISVDFVNPSGSLADTDTMAAVIANLSAIEVDDWDIKDGVLQWVRLHNVECLRDNSNPYIRQDKERHTWTYYDGQEIAIYEAVKDAGSWVGEDAMKSDEQTHEYPHLPVYEVSVTPGQWVMERIRDVVVAIFNRDAAVCKYLDDGAFQLLVLTLNGDKDLSNLIMSDMSGIKLEINESVEWKAPQAGFYDPMNKDQKVLKENLYEVIQSTAMNAAAIPQAGRLSGEAVNALRDPLHVLLDSFAWPIRDAFVRLKNDLAKHRGEDPKLITVTGMGEYVVGMDDMKSYLTGEDGEPTQTVDGEQDLGELNTSQETVLNGAQVGAAVEIVDLVSEGKLPRASGIGMLIMFFNMSQEEAEMVMGPAGTDSFTPTEEDSSNGAKSDDTRATEEADAPEATGAGSA